MVKKRCGWVGEGNPLMLEYHDREWGMPVHDDGKHFEFLLLEGAQAGLSWSIVLFPGYPVCNRRSRGPAQHGRFGLEPVVERISEPGGCCVRFFVHYTPFDETFDPHKLAAAYGTGLLDREGRPIATRPQVPGYVLDPCVARYTTNPLNVATIGVQTLMPPEQRGDIALQATYRTTLLKRLLTKMNEEFQRFLPAEKRDPDVGLRLDYMTVFLTTETTDDTRTAFPAADFLRMRVVNRRIQAEVANSYGANASYIFRDTDFYLILPTLKKNPDGTISTAEFGDCGKLNAMLYRAMFKATSPIGVLDRTPVSSIAVSDKYPLHRSGAEHPVLGTLYASDQDAARKLTCWEILPPSSRPIRGRVDDVIVENT
jgi:hypothetical protein